MAADFVVSTAFKSRDEMSKTFKRMSLSAKMFSKTTVGAFKRVERGGLRLKSVMGGVLGAAAVQRGLLALRQGVVTVTSEFLNFEDAITAASAKFGVLDRNSEVFRELGRTAREVGATTEFTSAQAAEGLRFLAKAGWDAQSAMKALPGFVDLATASEMEFARAADIATDVMGAFRLRTDDVSENIRQLTRVNDVLSKAVNMSNIDMEDLFETIKFAGPIAKTAGVSLEQFSAMAAFIGGAGIKGSLGGTALRTMFLNLVAPTNTIKGKLAEFNTEIKNVEQIKKNRKELERLLKVQLESGGKLKNPIQIMKQLSEGMADLSDAEKAAALHAIFGKRAVSGAAVAMDGATGKLQKFEQALNDSSGNAKKLAEFMRTALAKRLAELESAAIEVGFRFIDTFEKRIPGGIDAAIEAVRKFDVKKVVKALGEIYQVSKKLFSLFAENKSVLVGIGAGFAALKLAPVVAGMVSMVTTGAAWLAAGGFSAFFAGVAGAVGPLGAVVLALGGIAAGTHALVTNWDELTLNLKHMAQDMAIEIMMVGSNIKVFFIGLVQDVIESVTDMGNGVISFIRTVGQALNVDVLKNLKNITLAAPKQKPPSEQERRAQIQTAALLASGSTKGPLPRPRPGPAGESFPELVTSLPSEFFPPVATEQTPFTQDRPGEELGRVDLSKLKTRPGETPFRPGAGNFLGPDGRPIGLPDPAAAARAEAGRRQAARAQNEAQKQRVEIEGRIDIAGAPPGSTGTMKTKGAPPVRMNMLGAN